MLAVGLRGGPGKWEVEVAPHALRLKKPSSGRVPAANLEPSGEPLVLALRRDHRPALELWKAALKQPKALKAKKRKNVQTTNMDTVGRIHLGKQKTDEIQTRKVKALKTRE